MRCTLVVFVGLQLAAQAAEPTLSARLGNDRFRQVKPATAIAYTPDGSQLVTSDGDSLRFWDAKTGRTVKTIRVGDELIFALQFTPDAHRLYVATRANNTIRLCEIDPAADRVLIKTPIIAAWEPHCTFSPDGSYLVVIRSGNLKAANLVTRIVETTNGKEVFSEQSLTDPISAVAFRADEPTVAVSSWAGHVRLIDLRTGKTLHEYKLDHKVTGLTFSPDGKDLFAVTASALDTGFMSGRGAGVIRIGASDGRVRWKFGGSLLQEFQDLAIDADGTAVRYRGTKNDSDWTYAWWWLDAGTGKLLDRTMVADWGLVAVHPNGRRMAATGVSQWDLTTRKKIEDGSSDPMGPVTDLRFSPDGSKVLGRARGWYEWDTKEGTQVRLGPAVAPPGWGEHAIAASPDRKWLARKVQVPGRVPVVESVDLRTGVVRELISNSSDYGFRFLADGRLAAFFENGLTLFDPATGKQLVHIPRDPYGGEHLAASEDGTTAVVATVDEACRRIRVRRWNLTAGRQMDEWTSGLQLSVASREPIWGGALSPDGRLLAVWFFSGRNGSPPRHVVLFDVQTGRRMCGWTDQHRTRVNGRQFLDPSPVFRPDGRVIAWCSDNGLGVDLRETATGSLRRHIPAAHTVTGYAFGPDGRFVAVATWAFGQYGQQPAVATPSSPVELWDLDGKPEPWQADKADGLWDTLQSDNAKRAYDAIGFLRHHPAEAVAFLKERVKVPTAPAAEWVAARIKTLDAPQFRDREQATTDLAAAGELIVPELRAALKAASPEARRRLEGLFENVTTPSRETWRAIRVCEALEGIGTPDARELLATWAKGPPAATLMREAADSTERLNKRGKK